MKHFTEAESGRDEGERESARESGRDFGVNCIAETICISGDARSNSF